MGCASMNRYWNALKRVSDGDNPLNFRIAAPWKDVPTERPASGRLIRMIARYAWYPTRVSLFRGMDIVHVLDHSFAGLLRWTDPRAVSFVTVHDLVPLETDEGLTFSQVARFRRQCGYLRKADWILCDSDHTRHVLSRQLNIAGDHVVTVPLGTDLSGEGLRGASSAAVSSGKQGDPCLLVVGGVSPRKNLETLPHLVRGIRAGGMAVTVVKVGHPLPTDLARRIRKAGGSASSLKEVGMVDDVQLSELYRNVAFTFFPSTYEGFGLPVLEAMAQGCPVICSNATSIPEVGGDAVLYFAPDDVASAVLHAVTLLKSPELREDLRKRGRCRARTLSWKAHWEKLSALYSRGLEMQGR